ncbi:hypothetical protein BDW75DRAFT_199494 [Aspergillus navahoensis]
MEGQSPRTPSRVMARPTISCSWITIVTIVATALCTHRNRGHQLTTAFTRRPSIDLTVGLDLRRSRKHLERLMDIIQLHLTKSGV